MIEFYQSRRVEKSNRLFDRRVIEVYVESDEDVPFWHDVFYVKGLFAKENKVEFEFKFFESGKGKHGMLKQAMENPEFLGARLWMCVDSDCDYLLKDNNKKTKFINENSFVIQTYVYAIENYRCYAPALNRVLVDVTYDAFVGKYLDMEAFLAEYSVIVFDLFVFSVYFRSLYYEPHERDNAPLRSDDFKKIVALDELDNLSGNALWDVQQALENLRARVAEKLSALLENGNFDKDEIKNEISTKLADLGVTTENAYLFINGHTLYEKIVTKIIVYIHRYKTKEIKESIKKANENNEHAQKQALSTTHNLLKSVKPENVLATHKYYHECFLMKKVYADIDSAWQEAQRLSGTT